MPFIEERDSRGVDYDLQACLDYNPQTGFVEHDIAEVLAVVEGEHDESAWSWVLRLHDGRFVYLNGSCDYTGWDCQSGADSQIVTVAVDAANCEEQLAVRNELLRQLSEGRQPTARDAVIARFSGV